MLSSGDTCCVVCDPEMDGLFVISDLATWCSFAPNFKDSSIGVVRGTELVVFLGEERTMPLDIEAREEGVKNVSFGLFLTSFGVGWLLLSSVVSVKHC